MRIIVLAALAFILATAPGHAMTVTARVSGGNIAVHSGPNDGYPTVGRIADGSEIPIDYCTQTDSDSRIGSWGDAGHPLWPAGAEQWCRIPDTGWVKRSYIVGRGLSDVTPPDFSGPGW